VRKKKSIVSLKLIRQTSQDIVVYSHRRVTGGM